MSQVATYVMDERDARRLTERIRYCAISVRDGMEKLQRLVAEAQEGQAHVALGYASWTAYLADVLGEEPLRLPRDERREVVAWLAGEGMSTRAIAPIVGADRKTVMKDVREVVQNGPPAPSATTPDDAPAVDLANVDKTTGEIHDEHVARPVTGLDGKTYIRPEPAKSRRRPLVDAADDAGWNLRKSVERIKRITEDDRYASNKNEVTTRLRSHLIYAVEVCQDLLDQTDTH